MCRRRLWIGPQLGAVDCADLVGGRAVPALPRPDIGSGGDDREIRKVSAIAHLTIRREDAGIADVCVGTDPNVADNHHIPHILHVCKPAAQAHASAIADGNEVAGPGIESADHRIMPDSSPKCAEVPANEWRSLKELS